MAHDSAVANVAVAYNQAGGDYVAYADGDPTHLFAFDGLHAYADRRVWTLLEPKLTDLHATGASSISILDAGAVRVRGCAVSSCAPTGIQHHYRTRF